MPAKFRAIEALATMPHRPLSEYVENVRQIWSPENSVADKVRNFDLSHALEPFLDDRVQPVEISEIGSAKKRLGFGDVVISRLRSYLKQISIVRCSESILAVGSSEFIVLRPIGRLRSETILAFLRSDLIQTILKWSQDGTNHPRFDEETLLSIPVPDALVDAQNDIGGAVEAGISARQAMIGFIENGRRLIEAELSKGVRQ